MTSFIPFGDVYDFESNGSNAIITVNINDKREVLDMISEQVMYYTHEQTHGGIGNSRKP